MAAQATPHPAANTFGVQTGAADQTVVLDMTKTYHGISIQVGANGAAGEIIGRIQGWNPTFASREGIHIYELNSQTWGRPIDYVPGKESGRQITCTRVETWLSEVETIFGASVDQGFAPVGQGRDNPTVEWSDLCDQTQAFQCNEVWMRGNGNHRVWTYRGCWFTEKTLDEFGAESDPAVRASVTINYVVRHLTSNG